MDIERWWLFFLHWYKWCTPLGKYAVLKQFVKTFHNPVLGKRQREAYAEFNAMYERKYYPEFFACWRAKQKGRDDRKI